VSANGTNLILVVDDNETSRYAKVRILRQAGLSVVEAATGADALRLIAERQPRLVVLDIHLPDIDGWEVCRRIKGDSATASILVLQVSATHVRGEDTVRSLEGGADASLAEPIEPLVLIATVRALLRARGAEDALREALQREQAVRAAAEAANRVKDEFLATLSHELRSPLNAILTWATLLRSTRVDPPTTERALEAIERNTRQQARMIEDLLDVSRIISGKMRLEVAPMKLSEVADAALASVRRAAEAKAIQLHLVVDSALERIVGDAARVQQILWNLLSNAVKFTPPGGRVELRLDADSPWVRIQVSDSGRGMEPGFIPHAFERFRQADSSSTRSEGGLGLGLAIVRHLAELHGGTVEAESAGPGRGSRFTVRLPAASRPLDAARQPSERADRAERGTRAVTRLQGVRALVVDDEEDARSAIAAVLDDCGATVVQAGSTREALAVLDSGPMDVVVSDIAMPGEDGYALIAELRKRASSTATPALALTAYASAEEEASILHAGFDAYLAKPIGAKELADAVARLVARSGAGTR
jgi:signal transduction histidine kinase